MEVERNELGPLPLKRYEIRSYAKGTVHKNSHIYLGRDKHYYSVPYRHIGKQVKIVYTDSFVEIYHKHERLAAHTRKRQRYGYTTVAEPYAIAPPLCQRMEQREVHRMGRPHRRALQRDTSSAYWTRSSIRNNPINRAWAYSTLAKRVGNRRLDNACRRASDYGAYSYGMVERILKKGWDVHRGRYTEQHIEIPDHDNIRGGNYYK